MCRLGLESRAPSTFCDIDIGLAQFRLSASCTCLDLRQVPRHRRTGNIISWPLQHLSDNSLLEFSARRRPSLPITASLVVTNMFQLETLSCESQNINAHIQDYLFFYGNDSLTTLTE